MNCIGMYMSVYEYHHRIHCMGGWWSYVWCHVVDKHIWYIDMKYTFPLWTFQVKALSPQMWKKLHLKPICMFYNLHLTLYGSVFVVINLFCTRITFIHWLILSTVLYLTQKGNTNRYVRVVSLVVVVLLVLVFSFLLLNIIIWYYYFFQKLKWIDPHKTFSASCNGLPVGEYGTHQQK